MTPIRRFGWTALALFALVGCEAPTPPATTPPATTGTVSETHKAPTVIKELPVPDKAEAPVKLSDEQIAEIKKLPADEQPIALAQKVCPVSGDPLGGEMGIPIKQTIGDKTFYLCCASCEKKVKEKPDEVLADLAKLKK
jgi:Archaeal TRASH domain